MLLLWHMFGLYMYIKNIYYFFDLSTNAKNDKTELHV